MKSLMLMVALVANGGPPQGRGGHHRPPPEAYTACENQSEGAACTVQLGDHTITGTCRKPPNEEVLVCFPDHPPERQ